MRNEEISWEGNKKIRELINDLIDLEVKGYEYVALDTEKVDAYEGLEDETDMYDSPILVIKLCND